MNVAVILVIIVICFLMCRGTRESFTTDEALANLTSLYNAQTLTATNFNSTGTANLNNATIKQLNGPVNMAGPVVIGANGLTSGKVVTPDLNAASATIPRLNGDVTIPGKVTIGRVILQGAGGDDLLYNVLSSQNNKCGTGQPVSGTYDQLNAMRDGSNKCYSLCPPGQVMVGIRNGQDWDWKHPVCKKMGA